MLSADPGLFRRAAATLVGLGAQVADDVLQLRDEADRLFTVWQSSSETLLGGGPLPVTPGVQIPEIASMQVLYIECRWEDVFVDLVARIAVELTAPAWIVDSNDVTWPALQLDPGRIAL